MKNHRCIIAGLLALAAIVTASGCGGEEAVDLHKSPTPKAEAEEISFTTEDGVRIFADYYEGCGEEPPAVILLHMRGRDRKTWNPIVDRIVEKGYTVLAMDMRGHGKSTKKGDATLKYEDFGTAGGPQWYECRQDVHGAREALIGKGIDKGRIAIIGASVGCTIGVYYGSGDSGVKGLILLSPVIDIDRGVQQAAASFPDRKIFIYCSRNDDRGGDATSAREFVRHFDDGGAWTTLHPAFEGSDHGTEMLGKKYGELDVNNSIIKELDSIFMD